MKKKILLQKFFMTPEELSVYYMHRRSKIIREEKPIRGVRLRQMIHPLLLWVLALDRRSRHQTYEVIRDRRTASRRPHIFACTHIGYDDIATILESVKTDAYVFLGDPKTLYKDPAGLLLYLNGCVFVELQDRGDRKVSVELSKRTLQAGGSLLIFPEGVWNITESTPVLKLYQGAARFAMETGADIIPVAIDQIGSHFVVNIGENMDPEQYVEAGKMTEDLRTALATLKWEIFEERGLCSRAAVEPDEWKHHLRDIWGCRNNKEVTVEEIERGKFRDKAVVTPGQAFAPLQGLEPSRQNAFLFRSLYTAEI